MAKVPSSPIPQLKGVVPPSITKVTRDLTHYVVGSDVFLVKSQASKSAKASNSQLEVKDGPIEVFEVSGTFGEAHFMTQSEAEKKQATELKKIRTMVRNISKIFSVPNASKAEKDHRLKWLIENYMMQDIADVFGLEDIVDPLFVTPAHRKVLLAHEQYNFRAMHYRNAWPWLQNRDTDDHWHIPLEYQEVGPWRTAWVQGDIDLMDKIALVEELIDDRLLELLYNSAMGYYQKHGSLSAIDELYEELDLTPLLQELALIKKSLERTELGLDLHISRKGGKILYKDVPGTKLVPLDKLRH